MTTRAKRSAKSTPVEALIGSDPELLKRLVKESLQEVLEAEMTEVVGAGLGERMAVSRLRHYGVQSGQALQPVPARADCRRRARLHDRRHPHRNLVSEGRPAREFPREGQSGASPRLSG